MAKAEKKAVDPSMYDVVVSPVVTEKSQMGVEYNKVTFNVAVDATKAAIKRSVEALFEVKVTKVNVINVKGKTKVFRGTRGKRKDTRKAIVTLAEGNNIDIGTSI